MTSIKKLLKRCFVTLILFVFLIHIFILTMLFLWKSQPVNNTMFMVVHDVFAKTPVKQKWIEYKNISKYAKQAVIASEDSGFTKHHGFELDAMQRAFVKNQKNGKVKAGGSTISQQLAKNLFLTSHRSYIRKAEEAVITLMMENIWSKKRILTVYLNVVEFGDGIYGIEMASQHYFNKPAKKLTKSQSALLISMLPRPKYYQKHFKNKRLHRKKRIIMKRMHLSKLPK